MQALSLTVVSRYRGARDTEKKEEGKGLAALARRNVTTKRKKHERWPDKMVLHFPSPASTRRCELAYANLAIYSGFL